MLNTAFSPWPNYTDEEAEALARVLKSNKVNYWQALNVVSLKKNLLLGLKPNMQLLYQMEQLP